MLQYLLTQIRMTVPAISHFNNTAISAVESVSFEYQSRFWFEFLRNVIGRLWLLELWKNDDFYVNK